MADCELKSNQAKQIEQEKNIGKMFFSIEENLWNTEKEIGINLLPLL